MSIKKPLSIAESGFKNYVFPIMLRQLRQMQMVQQHLCENG